METEWLKEFEMLARTKKYSAAAAALHLSAPALTRHIQSLEEACGCQLLSRTTRSVSLTREGEIVLRHAIHINQEAALLQQELEAVKNRNAWTLSIGVIQDPDLYKAMDYILEFQHLFPQTDLQINEGGLEQLKNLFDAHELNLITWAFSPEHSGPEEFIPVGKSQLMAAMNPQHPLAGQDSVTLFELSRYSFIAPEKTSMLWMLLKKRAQNENTELHPIYQGSTSGAFRMLQGSDRILLQDEIRLQEKQNEDLILKPLDPPVEYAYGLLCRHGGSKAEEEFIQFAKRKSEENSERV